MTTRTRNFVIVSLTVLGVGLGTGLVAYYVGFPAGALGRQGAKRLVDPGDDPFVGTNVGKRMIRARGEDAIQEGAARRAVTIGATAVAHSGDGDITAVRDSEDVIPTLQGSGEEISARFDHQLGRRGTGPVQQHDQRAPRGARWLQRVVQASGVVTERARARGRG